MDYRFIIEYTPTNGQLSELSECQPLYGDDMAVTKNMESDEWFLRRKLEGKLTFVRGDYEWIMGRNFDGTFKMTVKSSTDGTNWYDYFTGSFSRANLEIDEDNQRAVLNGLSEGDEYNVIENGKNETYDLMKVIPDADAKEVQGQVHPALAMVDFRSNNIDNADIFCQTHTTIEGYKDGVEPGWDSFQIVSDDTVWKFIGIYAEAKVEMKPGYTDGDGIYIGKLNYKNGTSQFGSYSAPYGTLRKRNSNNELYIEPLQPAIGFIDIEAHLTHESSAEPVWQLAAINSNTYSPSSIIIENTNTAYHYQKIEIIFHYIRATLLTYNLFRFNGQEFEFNVLKTSNYYKSMQPFNNTDERLNIYISDNTSETPNGHRLIPGTGDQNTIPQYFAPPDDQHEYIPLAETNWTYASMWYTIVPSVANGLLKESNIGSFRWTRCWTLGTCLNRLLRKITDNKVTFDESTAGSEFLYSTVNPVTNGEPFEYLFTQKSNVMQPSTGGESAARCPVTLDWFLEFMRNGLNLYWWLEPRNGGTYAFRVEHVEWFRRGGSYTGQLNAQINLTEIKPLRNFLRNGDAAKRLDDQLHKYTYDMQGMTEKYTFSWQGDGGSDAFKGHPMFFKAGWIEKGTSESHEVDNIFADLGWLMLNAGSDTASSKNYEGIFVFSGYQAGVPTQWRENGHIGSSSIYLSTTIADNVWINIWCVVPAGQSVDYEMYDQDEGWIMITHTEGLGTTQLISVKVTIGHQFRVNFGPNYANIIIRRIHRVHDSNEPIYRIPNVEDLLGDEYLQNGPLAWPWLQNEYLHYDIPARMWAYKSDDLDELNEHGWWEHTGTVKLRKKQEVPLLPLPTKSDEDNLDLGVIGGLRDSNNQLQTGIVKEAKINLSSRNASLTLMYDMIS